MPLSQRGMRGAQPLGKHTVGGSLATPTAPQMTDVSPNRCGEPVNRLKGTHALKGGEEVSQRLGKEASLREAFIIFGSLTNHLIIAFCERRARIIHSFYLLTCQAGYQ
ncbi:MAG: hypothetical protein QXV47_00460 [Fervidicoccaceae archaeon]